MPSARKLGKRADQRRAMFRGMVTLLLDKGRIETTLFRAKELKRVADKMITTGKKNTLAAKRTAMAYITKEEVVKKLFDIIAPSFEDRHGGYTRVLKLGPRRGDGAEMAIIELVSYSLKEKGKDKDKTKAKPKKAKETTNKDEIEKPKKDKKETKETAEVKEAKPVATRKPRTTAKKVKEAEEPKEEVKEAKPAATRKPRTTAKKVKEIEEPKEEAKEAEITETVEEVETIEEEKTE